MEGCGGQFDSIWNHLEDKFLGMSVRMFLEWNNWSRKPHPHQEWYNVIGWGLELNKIVESALSAYTYCSLLLNCEYRVTLCSCLRTFLALMDCTLKVWAETNTSPVLLLVFCQSKQVGKHQSRGTKKAVPFCNDRRRGNESFLPGDINSCVQFCCSCDNSNLLSFSWNH